MSRSADEKDRVMDPVAAYIGTSSFRVALAEASQSLESRLCRLLRIRLLPDLLNLDLILMRLKFGVGLPLADASVAYEWHYRS